MANWDAAADGRLRALWAEGFSCAEIARRMALSKNAVVGRAHRMKLPARPSPILPRNPDAPRPMRSGGVRSPHARGAAALARAKESTETLRAEAFRRHAQQGGGEMPTGPVAQPIPAAAGIPARAGQPGAVDGHDGGVSSLTLPAAEEPPRPRVFSPPGARACRWPMWGNDERATHEFCGARVRQRRDGTPCVYCAAHAAKAFTGIAEPVADEPPHRVTHRSFAWGGRAA